jgi:ATP-binding cassette subfamily F protein 3
LDEPTNHLDLPSIEWLEKYLQHYQGAVVIVSHDKYFLNRMVTKIVEVYQEQLHIYNGNYEYYEKEKALRIDQQQKSFENQQDYIRQQERLIDRFRAKASKAAMAQSLIKKLDKLERIEDASLERPNMRINFRVDKTPGRIIAELKDVSKSFGNNVIIKHASAEIDRGDKIALIGANGKGKSTLLRIIAGAETFTGERKWGHNVDESFYAQHQLEALNVNNTILDEMKECGSQMTELELRSSGVLFIRGWDDADKQIKILSGGEKARVALAKTIISKANFLMLDEPTNHLDMHSCELLIEALNKYEGTIILVSHDRYFVSKTANKIWEIVDHEIKEFKGGYEEYVAWKERMARHEKEQVARDKGQERVNSKPETRNPKPETRNSKHETQNSKPETRIVISKNQGPAPINKVVKKELQKQQKIFQQLEEKIASANKQKTELEASLIDPGTYSDKNKFIQAEAAFNKLQQELKMLNQQYEQVFEKIMQLEGQ